MFSKKANKGHRSLKRKHNTNEKKSTENDKTVENCRAPGPSGIDAELI